MELETMSVSIDQRSKLTSIDTLISNVMAFHRRRWQQKINNLIDSHMLINQTGGQGVVRFRGKVWHHSNILGADKNIPKAGALDLSLFDRGTELYLEDVKLDNDKSKMKQILAIMMGSVKTWQDFRDALPKYMDPHAKPLSEHPRVEQNCMAFIVIPDSVPTVEKSMNLFAVYAMAELMEQA